MFLEHLGGKEVVTVTIIERDGYSAVGERLSQRQEAVDFADWNHSETSLEQPTHTPEAAGAYRQAIFGNLIGHAVKQQDHGGGSSSPDAQRFLGAHYSRVLV
jgi:hypothetical protein